MFGIPHPQGSQFADSYDQRDKLNVEDPWWDLLQELKHGPEKKQYLDIAQLIKHYLGLRKQFAETHHIVLAYLFWEPKNWSEFNEFKAHREEIARFADCVKDCQVRFVTMSYSDLWSEWDTQNILPDYVTNLRQRYCVEV